MNFSTIGLATVLVVGTFAGAAYAAEPTRPDSNTWYAYCEGRGEDGRWAVLSKNLWSHPPSKEYGRMVGELAERYYEARHGMRLDGCSGVDFADRRLAELSRERTLHLHEEMGDQVYLLTLPREELPPEDAFLPRRARLSDSERATAGAEETASQAATEISQPPPRRPRRPDR